MARRTKEEALETREKLLDAALDLFCEKGFSQTRLSDVAERIGMTRGALYGHFKNKPSLLAALIQEMHERERALVAEHAPEVMSLAGLKDYLVARIRIATHDEQCRKFVRFVLLQMEWSVEVMAAVREELMKFRTEPFEELSHILTQAQRRGDLRSGVDAKTAKDMLTGLWIGLLSAHFQGISATDPVDTAETALGALIDSLRA